MVAPAHTPVDRPKARPLPDCLRRLRDQQSGFTLIELMTVIGMLGITFTAAFMFFQNVVNRTADAEARSDTLGDLRVASERIARDVREAQNVSLSVGQSGDTLTITGASDMINDGTTVVYDCATTAGTCTRRVCGGVSETIAQDLDPAADVFRRSADSYLVIDLRRLPEDRASNIAISRGVALRARSVNFPQTIPCT